MRKLLTVGAVVSCLSLVAISPASAAIEVGDECAGNAASGPFSLVPEGRAPGSALPLATPTGGVVTSWKVNSAYPTPVPEVMAAFRQTAVGTFQVVGESNEEKVLQGLNVFSTRIPVLAGDRFGPVAVTDESPLFCATASTADQTWSFPGSVGVGSSHLFAAGVETRVPLIAVIEPDKDGDGYGDETQDKCPQSAAYQAPCPTITLDAFPVVLKRSVLVLVSSSSSSTVQVFGQVGLKLGPTAGGPAHISKTRKPGKVKPTGQIFGLAGGSQSVNPGEVTPFNVKLPKAVKHRLSQMTPKESLRASLAASTTDLVGRISTKILSVRLPGQKRPK